GLTAKWKAALSGLDEPGGFKSRADFYEPPNWQSGQKDFFEQTGLNEWYFQQVMRDEDEYYDDPTPFANKDTQQAVKVQGEPLYGDGTLDP
ncbi:hypothetical protein G3I76_45765, partial [Streptomyces sp. SID11233]|nr:hypothetical protein [Streptomyces sp. SID11233]